MTAQPGTIRVLRLAVRTLLLALVLFWFTFALLSGVSQFGEGIGALLRNWPNALPWLALLALVYVAFRWELVGGILIVLAGIVSVVFFNASVSSVVFLAVSLPLMVLGAGLILCWLLSRPRAR